MTNQVLLNLESYPQTALLLSRYAKRPVLRGKLLAGRAILAYQLEPGVPQDYIEIVNGIVRQLHDRGFPSFGNASDEVLDQKVAKDTPQQLGQVFAADLLNLRAKTVYDALVIDDGDMILSNPETIAFIGALVQNLEGSGLKVIVNGRTNDLDVWGDLILKNKAVVLNDEGTEEPRFSAAELANPEHNDNPDAPARRNTLDVKFLGQMRMSVNGQKEIKEWKGPLVANLIAYFFLMTMVTVEEIYGAFWPGLAKKEAQNVFHVTKRKISEVLGFEITWYSAGFYRILPSISLSFDVVDFLAAIKEERWLDAIELYKAELLYNQPSEMDWMIPLRQEYATKYSDALISQARIEEAANDWNAALRYYTFALRDRVQEEALRGIMRAYGKMGDYQAAYKSFQQAADKLGKIVVAGKKLRPDRRTVAVFEELIREDMKKANTSLYVNGLWSFASQTLQSMGLDVSKETHDLWEQLLNKD